MSKMKNFKMIMEKSKTNKVILLTNHYHRNMLYHQSLKEENMMAQTNLQQER